MAGGLVFRSFCEGWRTLTPHKGNDCITQCDSVIVFTKVYGKAPTQDADTLVTPMPYLQVATLKNKSMHWTLVIHMQERRPQERFLG